MVIKTQDINSFQQPNATAQQLLFKGGEVDVHGVAVVYFHQVSLLHVRSGTPILVAPRGGEVRVAELLRLAELLQEKFEQLLDVLPELIVHNGGHLLDILLILCRLSMFGLSPFAKLSTND